MSQIETTKVVSYVAIGPDSDEAAVTKLVAYVILEPGEGVDTSNRQARVHTQIMRRR